MFHVKHSTTRRRPPTRRSQPYPPINHHPAQCGTRPPAPAPPPTSATAVQVGARHNASLGARCRPSPSPWPTTPATASEAPSNRRRHPATGTNHCPRYLRPAPTGQLSTLAAAWGATRRSAELGTRRQQPPSPPPPTPAAQGVRPRRRSHPPGSRPGRQQPSSNHPTPTSTTCRPHRPPTPHPQKSPEDPPSGLFSLLAAPSAGAFAAVRYSSRSSRSSSPRTPVSDSASSSAI